MTISVSRKVEPPTSSNPDDDVVLSIRGVSKKFCRNLKRSLYYGVRDIAGEITGLTTKRDKLRPKEFWALSDVSFELKRGEALGLIGKNGSGKSTLLRIIAGLMKPDLGSIEVNGRVAPLIALGAGFNPILTGRENVYANMSILGLSKQQIKERFDEVIEFAEIGDAIDAPVQSYSSGMAARLGFASAIHTEPDIILIDEVLAVGDIRFRQKCYRKLYELRQKGISFILVSHNSRAILNVCDVSVYLMKGVLVASGETNSVMNRYEKDLFSNNGQEKVTGSLYLPSKSKEKSSGLDITHILFRDEQGNIIETPETGQFVKICIGCKAYEHFENAGLMITIQEMSGESDAKLTLSSSRDLVSLELSPGETELQVQMPHCCLKPGLYTMRVNVRKAAFYPMDVVESFRFAVCSDINLGGAPFYQPRTWNVEKI